MKNMLPVLQVSASLTVPNVASAANENGGFLIRGLGAACCQDLLGALTGGEHGDIPSRLAAWLSGYLTAASRARPTVYDVLPFDGVEGVATIVARMCASNQDARVEAVIHRALTLIEPLAGQAAETVVELRQAEQAVVIRTSVLVAVQERLIARGVLPEGAADGVFGQQTAQALREFQAAHRIEPTGLPDAWTVFVLQAGAQED